MKDYGESDEKLFEVTLTWLVCGSEREVDRFVQEVADTVYDCDYSRVESSCRDTIREVTLQDAIDRYDYQPDFDDEGDEDEENEDVDGSESGNEQCDSNCR